MKNLDEVRKNKQHCEQQATEAWIPKGLDPSQNLSLWLREIFLASVTPAPQQSGVQHHCYCTVSFEHLNSSTTGSTFFPKTRQNSVLSASPDPELFSSNRISSPSPSWFPKEVRLLQCTLCQSTSFSPLPSALSYTHTYNKAGIQTMKYLAELLFNPSSHLFFHCLF